MRSKILTELLDTISEKRNREIYLQMEEIRKGRTFVIGDIHGAYLSLVNLLEQVNFNYELDTLIVLGDVCDGWSQTPEAIEKIAREKLKMVKPNEIIYLIKGADASDGE